MGVWVSLLQGRVEHEWTRATPCFRPCEDLKDASLTGFSDKVCMYFTWSGTWAVHAKGATL
jgi:hypothetical protein